MKHILKNPFTKIVLMYVFFVLVGTLLLHMNIFINKGYDVSFIEAFFTSSSSFATTGLSVFNYSEIYNNLGQLLLIAFFNIGGMGIMTINTIIFIFIGKKIGVQNRVLAKIDLNKENTDGLVKLVTTIIIMFLTVEFSAAFLIFLRIGNMGLSFIDRVINSLFMASSAISGSGFYNTVPYKDDFFILTILIFLMIFSFIGYPVLLDLLEYIKHKYRADKKRYKFSNFTKISIMVNAVTLLMFAFIFLGLEWNNVMSDNTLFQKIYYSIFISTSTKSVGLNVFTDITTFMPMTLLFSTIFMIIGGSPSSACGGIRVSAVYVIYVYIKSQFRNDEQVVYGRHFVSEKTILKAFYVTFMFMILSFIGFVIILLTNPTQNLFYLWYDVISAITTTGFSTGALDMLNNFGILIVGILMFIGRIGIINLVNSVHVKKHPNKRVKYLEKDIII